MRDINRGDVYYVEASYSVGSEQRAGRPAVIVSNDRNNRNSNIVEVVYFTTKSKPDLPTHVTINATGTPSTALCEQVHTVDKQRLGNFCGTCTKQELQAIDISLMISLGLEYRSAAGLETPEPDHAEESARECVDTDESVAESPELIAVRAQLSIVQEMYNKLLDMTVR